MPWPHRTSDSATGRWSRPSAAASSPDLAVEHDRRGARAATAGQVRRPLPGGTAVAGRPQRHEPEPNIGTRTPKARAVNGRMAAAPTPRRPGRRARPSSGRRASGGALPPRKNRPASVDRVVPAAADRHRRRPTGRRRSRPRTARGRPAPTAASVAATARQLEATAKAAVPTRRPDQAGASPASGHGRPAPRRRRPSSPRRSSPALASARLGRPVGRAVGAHHRASASASRSARTS